MTPDRVLAAKGLGLFILGSLGGLYGLRTIGLLVVAAAVAATVGFFLPDVLLYNAGLKRQEKIQKALPDALDMLTVCVEAGLGFDAALAQVARNTTGPLAAEFSRVLQEIQIGKSRSQALRAMTDRTTVPGLRSFVSALVQAGELGITDRRRTARAGEGDAAAAQATCRGEGAEGAGENPVPAGVLPVPVHVRRHHRPRRDQHHPRLLREVDDGLDPLLAQGVEAILPIEPASRQMWARGDSFRSQWLASR